MKDPLRVTRNKKLQDVYEMRNYKGGAVKLADEIKNLVIEIGKKKVRGVKAVQAFLASKHVNEIKSSIVKTILNCKQIGEKISLNNNFFAKKLNAYLYGDNIGIRCLTTDSLSLAMIYNSIVKQNNLNKALFEMAQFITVKVISDNFKVSADTKTGMIQDYDSNFSAICPSELNEDIVRDVIQRKENMGRFVYLGLDFMYFGDRNLCIICEDGLADEQIFAKFQNQKYLKVENNRITEGEKSVPFNDKIHFIDKLIVPEDFCPSYWITTDELVLKMFFSFEIDYDSLFGILEVSAENNQGKPNFISNMLYWDSLQSCFEFLTVYALTSEKATNESAQEIAGWCDFYYEHRTTINKIRDCQLLLHRCVSDFLNGFVNNSEYMRFINLNTKIEKYISEFDKVSKLRDYQDVINFFNSLSFCQMINNQFKPGCMGLANSIRSTLRNYLSGSNPTGIAGEIRATANQIKEFLPKKDMNECAFPFIVAGGSVFGNSQHYESKEDPLKMQVEKVVQRRIKKREKEKKEISSAIDITKKTEIDLESFLMRYLAKYMKEHKIRRSTNNRGVVKKITSRLKNFPKRYDIVLKLALSNKGKEITKRFRDDFLDKLFASELGMKKKIEIIDEEEEEEIDTSNRKGVQTRSKAKKKSEDIDEDEEMEIEDEK